MERNVFLVDFENVDAAAFTGISSLTTVDEVYVLYTKACIRTSKTLERFYLRTKATLTMAYVENGHKNALDFQLSALLGRLTCEEKYKTRYYIIAKDKGYDCLSIFLQRYGVMVERKESILSALVPVLPNGNRQAAIGTAKTEEEAVSETLPIPLSPVLFPDLAEAEATQTKKGKKKKSKKEEKKAKREKKEKHKNKVKAKDNGKAKVKINDDPVFVVGKFQQPEAFLPLPEPDPAPLRIISPLPPAPKQAPAPEASPVAKQEEVDANLESIRAFFAYSGKNASLAVDAYLYAKRHPEEEGNAKVIAHRYLMRTLHGSKDVKKIYDVLKPFLNF